MRLYQYRNTPGGGETLLLTFINFLVLVFTFIFYLFLEIEFSVNFSFYFLCVLGIIACLLIPIIPKIFDVRKILVTSFAFVSGLCLIILGVLSLIPSLEMGWSFITIFHFGLGAIIFPPSIIAQIKEERKAGFFDT